MLPQSHFILGVFFVVFLYFFFSPTISIFGLGVILLSSVLIDFDHYVYYILKKKNLNLLEMYKWYIKYSRKICSLDKKERKKVYLGIYFLHGVESLTLLFFLGTYISQFFIFIFIGFFFHLVMDFIAEIIFEQRIDKISFIYNFFAFKKLKHIENFEIAQNNAN